MLWVRVPPPELPSAGTSAHHNEALRLLWDLDGREAAARPSLRRGPSRVARCRLSARGRALIWPRIAAGICQRSDQWPTRGQAAHGQLLGARAGRRRRYGRPRVAGDHRLGAGTSGHRVARGRGLGVARAPGPGLSGRFRNYAGVWRRLDAPDGRRRTRRTTSTTWFAAARHPRPATRQPSTYLRNRPLSRHLRREYPARGAPPGRRRLMPRRGPPTRRPARALGLRASLSITRGGWPVARWMATAAAREGARRRPPSRLAPRSRPCRRRAARSAPARPGPAP